VESDITYFRTSLRHSDSSNSLFSSTMPSLNLKHLESKVEFIPLETREQLSHSLNSRFYKTRGNTPHDEIEKIDYIINTELMNQTSEMPYSDEDEFERADPADGKSKTTDPVSAGNPTSRSAKQLTEIDQAIHDSEPEHDSSPMVGPEEEA
jgi:hypothetical protein